MAQPIALDDFESLCFLLDDYWRGVPRDQPQATAAEEVATSGDAYCGRCGRRQRMLVCDLKGGLLSLPEKPASSRAYQEYRANGSFSARDDAQDVADYVRSMQSRYVPLAFLLRCLQCKASHFGALYESPNGPAVVILSSDFGGATPNTPETVAYYLDQAHRAHAIGANSAAIGAYRCALENLLFDQGFRTGMLHAKLIELAKQTTGKTAPEWAYRIDTDFLTIIKDLGNTAMHPNDGDIQQQFRLDSRLVRELNTVFAELLDVIYEQPVRSALRKQTLLEARVDVRGHA